MGCKYACVCNSMKERNVEQGRKTAKNIRSARAKKEELSLVYERVRRC